MELSSCCKTDAETADPLKGWRFLAIFWPLSCLIFTGIILFQSVRGMEERIFDMAFTLLPLIFFAVGMNMRHRLLKERGHAAVLTTATVVSIKTHMHSGNKCYFPEFEFHAGGETYRVKYSAGYSFHIVDEGQQTALYYDPENPELFYVPAVQKHDLRWSSLLCGVGILFPLLGLSAPLLRELLIVSS